MVRLSDRDMQVLLADPRYKAFYAAAERTRATLKRLEEEARAAIKVFEEETGVEAVSRVETVFLPPTDVAMFTRFRPMGDKMRIARKHGKRRDAETEVEIVSYQPPVISTATSKYDSFDGRQIGVKSYAYFIHPDDLAAIKAGTLRGWRQKPWGQP